ncbi:MAG: hypothetical protein Kow0069_17410 [Promethearchaeota archaeon]
MAGSGSGGGSFAANDSAALTMEESASGLASTAISSESNCSSFNKSTSTRTEKSNTSSEGIMSAFNDLPVLSSVKRTRPPLPKPILLAFAGESKTVPLV